jgi:quercetin dioxygenase-like cupin family protein
MDIVKFEDAPFYNPPNHEGVISRRLQGDVVSKADFAWVGYSDFPPGVIVPMEAGTFSKMYVVTAGSLTIEQADGTRHLLREMDSIFIPAGEARSVINDSGAPAAIIVVTPAPAI